VTRVLHKARRRPEAERAARRQAAVRVVEAQVAAVQAEAPARRQLYPMRHAEMVLPWTRGAPATDLVPELSLSLLGRRAQRASILARKLGRRTTHSTGGVCVCVENEPNGWRRPRRTETRGRSRYVGNEAPSLTIRRLRIARHHAIGHRRRLRK
jgi:hypothetical protein